ncbi:nucleoporin Nup186/Nup192/Nup205 [Dichotomocladium elegans]|nr:nucleoporin Nup186/Nup192/Nup205 [Dichotomocladium elegans]
MQDQFRLLFDQLCQARVSTSSSVINGLEHLLQCHKDEFLRILDDKPKNNQDRTTLQGGKAIINGKEHKVNEEFIKQAIFLSDQLGINEHIAASWLMFGLSEAPRANSNAIDTAITMYHSERGFLLQCLDLILTASKDLAVNDEIRNVFQRFTTSLMQECGSFVGKILGTIKKLQETINSIQTAGSVQATQQPQQQPQPQPTFNLATSSTTLASTTKTASAGPGRLGEDITAYRLDRLAEERISLSQILYHLASVLWLEPQDVISLEETLEKSQLTDVLTPYLMLALVTALSINANRFDSFHEQQPLYRHADFLKKFQNKMLHALWKVPAAKSVVVMQWVLFLTRAVQVDSDVESWLPAKEDELSTLVDFSIGVKVFEFLNNYLLYFQQPDSEIEADRGLMKTSLYDDFSAATMAVDGLTVDPSDFTKFNADIRPEFQKFVIHEVEQFSISFIENLQNVLSKMRYKEEDMTTPVQAPLQARNALTNAEDEPVKNHDLQSFMELLASIYRNRINSGYRFWSRTDSNLHQFIKWVTDIKVSGTVGACYSFFASISTGDMCAPHAFEYFSSNTNRNDLGASSLFSWGKLFAAIHFYLPLLRTTAEDAPSAFPADEEELLRQFLFLLQQVVQYSVDARKSLWFDTTLRAPQSIYELITCETSVELRASVFNVLAAFCSPWGGGVQGVGRSISEYVWELLDTNGFLVSKRESRAPLQSPQDLLAATPAFSNQQLKTLQRFEPVRPPRFLRDLAMEKATKVYVETLAVLNLLGSAIHTVSKREDLLTGFMPQASTMPWTLGKGSRSPGAAPYISFVIDNIFVGLDQQEYLYPGSKWQLSDACLKILENSIMSLDLRPIRQAMAQRGRTGSLMRSTTKGFQNGVFEELLQRYLTHPGFTVVVRLLSGHRLVTEMLKIVEAGPAKIEGKKHKSLFFTKCVTRCLRIIHKVLEDQDTFCNLLVPSITGFSSKMSSSELKIGDGVYPPIPSLVPFGQVMLYNANAIVQLAQLVNCEDQVEICYLSTKILEALSREPDESNVVQSDKNIHAPMGGLGSKLAKVLRGCKDEANVLHGFSERLEINAGEYTTPEDYDYDSNNIPFWQATSILQNKYLFESDFGPTMSSSVRIAILDLLLENAASTKPSPSFTDFLFGYVDSALGAGHRFHNADNLRICFRSFISLINEGVASDSNAESEFDLSVQLPLVATHPILAEKCYQLVYRLCAKESTSASTMRYLRDKVNFFYNHLRAMPARLETYSQLTTPMFPGNLVAADGVTTRMDFFALRSQLHQRAWLLKSIALELHLMAGTQQKSSIKNLLELLYGNPETLGNDMGGEGMNMDREENNIFYFGGHSRFQQPLVKMLEVVSSLEFTWIDELTHGSALGELKYFNGFKPEHYQVENVRDCIVYDIRSIYQVLREEQGRRQSMGLIADEQQRIEIEDEMGRILQWLMAENHKREITQGKLHCLRAWKQIVQVTLSECFDLFPLETREKIIYGLLSTLLPKMKNTSGINMDILKGFSEVILTLLTRLREDKRRQDILEAPQSKDVEFTRLPDENLRVIFGGILECIQEEGTTMEVRGDMYTALVNFLHYVGQQGGNSVRKNQQQLSAAANSIQKQFIDAIARNDRFLNMLCTDASDGAHVWKTTAYITLDALYVLSIKADSSDILEAMVKKNFLRYSIEMIRRDDVELLKLLESADADLKPLYIHEAKLALFLRLALSKHGAKLLVENRIVEVLGHCQFIAARPEPVMPRAEYVQLAPSLLERYDRLLLPTIKLLSALLCSLGSTNSVLTERIENWCRMQQETLLFILKDDHPQTTIATLSQLKLTTSILYHLSSRPGFFDNLVTRRMNHLHTSMVHLIAKYLNPKNLAGQVVPITEEEKILAQKQVGNRDPALPSANATTSTGLSEMAEQIILSIQMNLAAYAQNAAFVFFDEKGNNTFKPVFSNMLGSMDDNGTWPTQNASRKIPSLSTLAACIRHITQNLQGAIAERKLLSAQRNNVDSLKFEEVREIGTTAFPQTLGVQFDHLSPSQQQQVLITEVEKRSALKVKEIRHLIFILENILFVLWRHLEYYMQSNVISKPATLQPLDLYSSESFAVSSQTAMFQSSVAVANNLKTQSKVVLDPLLKKLEELDIDIPELQGATLKSLRMVAALNKVIQA